VRISHTTHRTQNEPAKEWKEITVILKTNMWFQVRMEYGGGDITQTFYWLLQKCAFPYKTCNPDKKVDAMLLKSLKESFCHVNLVSFRVFSVLENS
jgi:hypothetical protein